MVKINKENNGLNFKDKTIKIPLFQTLPYAL